jgi:hypothetical protein
MHVRVVYVADRPVSIVNGETIGSRLSRSDTLLTEEFVRPARIHRMEMAFGFEMESCLI